MRFYEIDGALQEAINQADKPLRIKVEIMSNGSFETVNEQSIIEANFFGLKEMEGGTTARGEITINNEQGIVNNENSAGREIKVSFSMGEGLPYFQRFRFFIDEKGIQDIKGPGRKRFAYIRLQDLSAKLKKTDEAKDWSAPAVFTYSVVCDKTQPDKSLVHGIAQRAGLCSKDIDCSTIPVTLPYVLLKRNTWQELSSLATAYRCHLECPVEKPLVFAHSPYQSEQLEMSNEQCSFIFSGEDIFYLRKTARAGYYRNSIRLKVNMPVALEKREIWHYDERPVFYDDLLKAYYPFRSPLIREIEKNKYEANYMIIDENGKERNVVYADQIDTKEEAESRLEYVGGQFSYSHYDVTTNYDKASLTIHKTEDGDLFNASIYGRPIILDLNRSCFVSDTEHLAAYGTVALNVTGSYFSEHEINGKPQYEDWVIRELAERLQNKQEFTVKTHKALFNARVGARVKVKMKSEEMEGVISAFSFRYKKDKAFVAAFRVNEQ